MKQTQSSNRAHVRISRSRSRDRSRSGSRGRSRSKGRKPKFVPSGSIQPTLTRQPISGQNDQVKIQAIVDPNNFAGICAAFVLYGLSLGAPRNKATEYMGALQRVFKTTMADSPIQVSKAPRIFWALQNAMRPKTVVHQGMTYNYSFDHTFEPQLAVNPFGCVFGATAGTLQGLSMIADGSYVLPEDRDATELLGELFGFFKSSHSLIDLVDDYKDDPSLFAWKTENTKEFDNWDKQGSGFSQVSLEVPIRSWLGFCGLASGTWLDDDDKPARRVPKFADFVQGAGMHYVGTRLYYPQFQARKHVKTKINFNPIDISSWLLQNTDLLVNLKDRLNGSGRVQTGASGAIAPDNWRTLEITKNLFLLSRYRSIVCSFLPYACMWAGASQGFPAIAVGTNLIDPILMQGVSDIYCNTAVYREMCPSYNRTNDQLVVPFPSVFEDAVLQIWTAYPNILPDSAAPKAYGGPSLDLLNSQIAGVLVSLIDGDDLRDDMVAVGRADNGHNQMIPTSGSLGSNRKPTTTLATQALFCVLPSATDAEKLGRKYHRFAARDTTAGDANFAKFLELKQKAKDAREQRRTFNAKKGTVMAEEREGIDTTTLIQQGTVSCGPISEDIRLTSLMMQPLKLAPFANVPDSARIAFDMPFVLKSSGQSVQSLAISRSSNGDNFIKDPTSSQGTEIAQSLLNLGLGPSTKSVGAVVGPILGELAFTWGKKAIALIVDRVKARRARRRAANQ